MADFEPPSFSLGLDLDSQSTPRLRTTAPPNPSPQLQDSSADNDSLHELERAQVDDLDVEMEPNPATESSRVFKRLRRGPGPGPTIQSLLSMKNKEEIGRTCADDEIEEFSSPEDSILRDEHLSTQYRSVCSSSKVPLQGHAVLTTQSTSQLKARKREQASDVPSANLPASQNEFMFPKLTISPLRRFQLLDSDSESDHPSVSKDVNKKAHRLDPSLKESKSVASEEKRKVSSSTPQDDDLWKDFGPMKSFHIPTPALDEVCEEYFSSMKKKDEAQKMQTNACVNNNRRCHPNINDYENFEQCWDSSNPHPPAHRYFFHSDPRIQKLVRSRLPNFSPIGVVPDRGNQQPSASVIDYMSQFTNREASKQKGTRNVNNNKSSTRGRNKSKRSNAEEVSHDASGSWIDPKSCANIPKDAGKRRVHASGQSAGHWYTSPEGRKVYLSKNGQELTGQIAYRQYRKESGGYRKSKKKTGSKKKKTKS